MEVPTRESRGVSVLDDRIVRLIRSNGPITVAQFMTVCLYDPEYGYYANREPIGARGDFITAPEISQMFGELIGLWCAQVWLDQGQNQPVEVIELGPGRGTLMTDALRALRVVPAFLADCRVTMIEASAHLREEQRLALRDVPVPIEWKSEFALSDGRGPLFVIGNEFLDALPIRQFIKTSTGWHERMVFLDENAGFAFGLAPQVADPLVPADRRSASPGTVFERCDAAVALVQEIASAVGTRGGGALFIDYGHGEPNTGETLQAISAHKAVGLLDQPGTSDLSAHVDFQAIANAAGESGARSHGPLEQGLFLRAMGIDARAERLGRSEEVLSALDRLTSADAMGSLFKALAVVPDGAPTPPGFS